MKMTGQLLQVKKKKLFLAMLFLLLLTASVSAFGVSAPYWSDNPLYVSAGDTREVTLLLQHLAGEEVDLLVRMELISGQEIAKIKNESTINLPFGSDNIPVPITLQIPETAQQEEKWTITVKFMTTQAETDDGTIHLNTGVEKSFDVIVRSSTEQETTEAQEAPNLSENTNLMLGIIMLVLIITLGIIIYLSAKGKKDEKRK